VAESASVYNNSEFLRVNLAPGSYALRITLNGVVYETQPEVLAGEEYGLARQVIPEPSGISLVLLAGLTRRFALRTKVRPPASAIHRRHNSF